MKGLIICGYPGVGKTSVGGWNNCIDLESTDFKNGPSERIWSKVYVRVTDISEVMANSNMDKEIETLAVPAWVDEYCRVGINLADQGYIVLMSTHKDVITYLSKMSKSPVVIFCPKLEWRTQWFERVQRRYEETGLDKHRLAMDRVYHYYMTDIEWLMNFGLPVYQPDELYYNFRSHVAKIIYEQLFIAKFVRPIEQLPDDVQKLEQVIHEFYDSRRTEES